MTDASPPSTAPQWFQLRCSFAYAAPISLNGILLPYLPIWLHSLAFTPSQIGMILAVQVAARVAVSPLTGFLARILRSESALLVWSAALSLLSLSALFFSRDFLTVLVVVALQAAIFAPYAPIVETIAISGVKRWRVPYGAMRVWGSIGFVAATLSASGFSSLAGPDAIIFSAAAVIILAVIAAFVAPRLHGDVAARAGRVRASPKRAARIEVHALLIGASLIQASHGMFYGFSTIQWQAMGFSNGVIAMLWSVGVVAEIVVFFAAGRLARRFSPWTLLRIGCLAAILRWLLFPVGFDALGYAVLQVGHAFSFALVHLGLQYRLAETVDEDAQASAQGAYLFYNGAFLALSTLLSGWLYRMAGLYGYLAMAVLAVIGLCILLAAARLQPQRAEEGG